MLVYLNRKIVPLGDGTWMVNGRARKGKKPPPNIIRQDADGGLSCGCEGCRENGDCPHCGAVRKWLADGPPSLPYGRFNESRRPWYPQDSPRYRAGRQIMARALPLVVRALARSIYPVTGARVRGRPATELADLVVCIALRVFHGRGGTISQGLVEDAFEQKLLYRRPILHARPPSEEAVTLSMRSERAALALEKLIEASNSPYRGRIATLLIDGSEYEIPTLIQAKNHATAEAEPKTRALEKSVRTESSRDSEKRPLWHQTVKVHAAVSAEDGMIVAAVVTSGKTHDSTQAVDLIDRARRTRFVEAAVADKAYLTNEIISHCREHGINAVVPAKTNSSEETDTVLAEHVAAWRKRDETQLDLYAKRNLVECAFSRMKRLLSAELRSRTFAAQRTELLTHALVANCTWLIAKYVAGEVEIDWLDDRCRAVLDPARDAVADHPHADRSPRFRDGMEAA